MRDNERNVEAADEETCGEQNIAALTPGIVESLKQRPTLLTGDIDRLTASLAAGERQR